MLMRIIVMVLLILCGMLFTGCSKESILKGYNTVLQSVGDLQLTFFLKGERTYGEDHYTGNYNAKYVDYTGTEYLFGGTSTEREAGNIVTVNCQIEAENGNAYFFLLSGSEDPVILLEEGGTCQKTVTLPNGSNYFGITGTDFSGEVQIEIK